MSFNVANTGSKEGGGSNTDWEALNAHIIEAAGTVDAPRNIVGIISSIVDLGVQERTDAKMEWNGNAEAEAKAIEDQPNTYFEDDSYDGKRYKRWPQRPCQQVAVTVDFPQIITDKGQFFGDSNPVPYRMLLNGEFLFNAEGGGKEVRVNRPFDLNLTKKTGVWSLAQTATLYKMAKAAGLVKVDGSFLPQDIDQLLGKPFQFEMRAYMKPNKKDASKSYFTEDIKFVGMPAEGVAIPELDASLITMIQFTEENNPESLKFLRASLKRTIQRANNYSGSVLEAQLGALGTVSKPSQGVSEGSAGKASEDSTEPPVESTTTDVPPGEDWDDDIPF
jgi:hypothetical protein